MNILILNWKDVNNPKSGGAETVTHEHAKRWVKKGHRVTWLTSSFHGASKEERIDGIDVFRMGNIYTLYLLAPFFYFFSGRQYDLLIDEVHGIPFFTPLYSTRRRIVLIHEIAGQIWDKMYPFPVNLLGKFLERFYLNLYSNDVFWTDAKATLEELRKNGVKNKKSVAIPCPSNVKPLTKLPEKNRELTFITVSRLVKMKGIEDVIKAFSIIKQTKKRAKLFVVGNGEKPYVAHLNNYINELGLSKSVFLLGFIDGKEKEEIIKKSHLLLHASIKEGWGLVVIEAAALGTPSIVYSNSGLKESVKNGKTGIVVTHNSPNQLAKESLALISKKNTYREMQLNGLKWAKSLTWEKAVKQTLKLINDK